MLRGILAVSHRASPRRSRLICAHMPPHCVQAAGGLGVGRGRSQTAFPDDWHIRAGATDGGSGRISCPLKTSACARSAVAETSGAQHQGRCLL